MILSAMAGKTRVVQMEIGKLKFSQKDKIFQDLAAKSYSVRLKLSIIYLSIWHKLKNLNFRDLAYLPDHNWFLLIKGNRLTGYG